MASDPVLIPVEDGVYLDELQVETEQLLALLKDRHPRGLIWESARLTAMLNMRRLISEGLGLTPP